MTTNTDLDQREFSVMQLSITSISANGYALLSFLSTLKIEFDIICLTETQLVDLEQADSVSENYIS